MACYDGRGREFPLSIVRDADMALTLTVSSGGSPVNMSSATIEGEIYDSSGALVATMSPVVSGPSLNVVTLSLSDTVTALLLALSYRWTLWVTRGGDRRPWLASTQVSVSDGTSGQSGTSGSYTLTVDEDVQILVDVAAIGSPTDVSTILTANGDLLTRTAGVPNRITRAALAADPAFSGQYAPLELLVAAPTGVAATDTAAIQAALNTARIAGGGIVRLRAGTYALTLAAHPVTAPYFCALTIGSKTSLVGAGRGTTILKLAAAQTLGNDVSGSNIIISNRTLTGGDTDITISDLTIDGDAANQTHTHGGIGLMRVRSSAVDNVTVTNCRGTANSGTNETFHFDVSLSTDVTFTRCQAIGTAGSTASGLSANSSSNIKWSDCVAYGMTVAHGFAHNTCQNLQHVNCHSFKNGEYGFSSEVSIDVVYIGCIAGGDSTLGATFAYASNTNLGNVSNGFTINGSTRTQIVGCIARHNNGNGINGINTSSGVIVGGEVSTSQFGGLSFDTSSCGGWRCAAGPINVGNGVPQFLNGVSTAVFGAVTPPAVPASTVAYASIYSQDAMVHVTGGTVTVIAINGTATGLTSGSFRVPAGGSITLTYGVAPTWTWFLA